METSTLVNVCSVSLHNERLQNMSQSSALNVAYLLTVEIQKPWTNINKPH